MSLSRVLLVLWVFFVSTVTYLAWWTVDERLIGFVGLVFVGVAVLESFRPISLPLGRRNTASE